MRRPRIHKRDFRSNVQITNVSNTKDIMRQIANGESLELNVTGVTGSYDFEDGEIDWDAPLVEDAPNKIEQQFRKGRYINVALSEQSDSNPSPEPAPEPQPDPAPES